MAMSSFIEDRLQEYDRVARAEELSRTKGSSLGASMFEEMQDATASTEAGRNGTNPSSPPPSSPSEPSYSNAITGSSAKKRKYDDDEDARSSHNKKPRATRSQSSPSHDARRPSPSNSCPRPLDEGFQHKHPSLLTRLYKFII
ncbi:hypothetical protein QQS21_012251 [Conoideocrella luteorostrata]|uniref:Uncharacterized protein n=1 Tax=Conoideocrella luteorostrata TaxID=1105319 RepID=A0AAJ0CBI2_9HYPO|nr:hypothetical protein QQS21_012251 [Conoideocrella luteorostrata]